MKTEKTIALIGNPNSGKTSLFNLLTGMHQHTSNFPGTTVSVATGILELEGSEEECRLIDFPGAYSFFATSSDEKINVELLTNTDDENHPDLVVYVADITKLSRHFLLASQIIDLGIPTIIVLNMSDLVEDDEIDLKAIRAMFEVPVICVSSRKNTNISTLKSEIAACFSNTSQKFTRSKAFYKFSEIERQVIIANRSVLNTDNDYLVKIISHHASWLNHITEDKRVLLLENNASLNFEDLKYQIRETMHRYEGVEPIFKKTFNLTSSKELNWTDKIDNVITHRVVGPMIFFSIMFFIFQVIFSWANIPMDMIESGFGLLAETTQSLLGDNWMANLIVEGVIPGLAGVFVFLPQIIMLFFFIAILEESGYMSRVVFMFDGLLAKFGMNGRSIVALISSGACAIPAIMSTRTISNFKERLITIMVTPLISCSARIPVYTALIGFVVPSTMKLGIFNAQGLAFMGLYLLGVIAALLSALVFRFILKTEETSYLMLEMPQYKRPIIKNIFYYVSSKVFAFIKEAGKIILLVSMILWFMASYGPGDSMNQAEVSAVEISQSKGLSISVTNNLIASKKIEASYAGILGKFIEPAVRPLGYDWKMGIALITSFAAREVFVGTMATIYSIGGDDDVIKIRDTMAKQVHPITGSKVYNFATSLSLLMFYVFALQCLSTLAVTYKETKSIKWPIIQFAYMGALAYIVSFVVFNVFS